MKSYQVEFERKSYVTICVEANSQGEAESLAWRKIENATDVNDAHWDITYIEEQFAIDDSRSNGPHTKEQTP